MKVKKTLPRDVKAALLVSVYLLVYLQLIWFEATRELALIMLLFSPVMLIWMAYMIIRHGIYKGRDLDKDEFGYLDREKQAPDQMGKAPY